MRHPLIATLFLTVRHKILGLKFGAKMTLFYGAILTFSLLTSTFFYQRISSNILSHKVSEVSLQNLRLIASNIRTIIENASHYSITIMADENNIQHSLRNAGARGPNGGLTAQRTINRYLLGMLEVTPMISSIYIFDNNGNRYYADSVSPKTSKYPNIGQAPWFREVMAKKGGYLLKLNAEGVFKSLSSEKYVSLIRVINDLDRQQPLGILIVNVSSDSFLKSFVNPGREYGTDFILKDGRDQVIAGISNPRLRNLTNYQWQKNQITTAEMAQINRRWFLFSSLNMEEPDWRLMSMIPFDELSRESRLFGFIALMIILGNGLLLFFSSVLLSKFLTVPINKLLHSMKDVEKGRFKMVEMQTHSDEIGQLKDGYNMMVQEIQKLIHKRVAEQRTLRKAELDVLQAQIKPHFLYNTFDAISSLALAGRNEEVYTLVKALGSFYRTSLSKGNEVITIGAELETVRSYLTIQKIRYGALFEVEYDIDAGINDLPILKLILQPLVENALYHGIRPKGAPGVIRIRAKDCRDYLELTVADDGVGMTEVDSLLKSAESGSNPSRAGFGLRGTLERLRIFYGVEDILAIESKVNGGTRITIHIPVEGREENGECIIKCFTGR